MRSPKPAAARFRSQRSREWSRRAHPSRAPLSRAEFGGRPARAATQPSRTMGQLWSDDRRADHRAVGRVVLLRLCVVPGAVPVLRRGCGHDRAQHQGLRDAQSPAVARSAPRSDTRRSRRSGAAHHDPQPNRERRVPLATRLRVRSCKAASDCPACRRRRRDHARGRCGTAVRLPVRSRLVALQLGDAGSSSGWGPP